MAAVMRTTVTGITCVHFECHNIIMSRCLIPSYIPDVIKWQMAEYLHSDCNFSVPESSATPTMSFTPLISTSIQHLDSYK